MEIGAGTGYWARCLQERGVDVIAYDVMGEDWARWFHPKRLGVTVMVGDRPLATEEGDPERSQPWQWTDVLRGDIESLAAHPDRTLLMVWPDYATDFALNALRGYPGQHIAYVGEGQGGCTGTQEFHDVLEREWDEVEGVSIPQWWGIHDHLWVYRRR